MLAAQTTKGPRSLAIAEGLLLDVTPAAREVEIEYPVALTRALWQRCVSWPLLSVDRRGTMRTRLLMSSSPTGSALPNTQARRRSNCCWSASSSTRSPCS